MKSGQSGFHRIRHYGLIASPRRAANIRRLRHLIAAGDETAQPFRNADPSDGAADPEPAAAPATTKICPCCGGRMSVIETFARGAQPRSFKAAAVAINSS